MTVTPFEPPTGGKFTTETSCDESHHDVLRWTATGVFCFIANPEGAFFHEVSFSLLAC